jgi:RNA polymerase sigma-54 factor
VSKRYVEEMRKKDDSAKAFLRDRVAAAKNFIAQLEFCKKTILRVAEAIVARQEDFLRNGPGHMKPLTMLELAEELGLSESTVSRTISGKYMDTPQGLMGMKDFITRAAISENGVLVSNSDAKNLLKEIVDGEDKTKPLGDEEIRKRMEEKGCAIARRTVVKYREALGIPSSRLRKKL